MPKTTLKVSLLWKDRNAFFILGTVQKALRKAGLPELAEKYVKEAMAGDYYHLLDVTMDYVEVE